MANHNEFLRVAAAKKSFLDTQRNLLLAEDARYEKDIEGLAATLLRTRREIYGYLVPDFDDEDLVETAARLQHPGLLGIKKEHSDRLQAGEERRVLIEASDELQNYDVWMPEVSEQIESTRPVFERLEARWKIPAENDWFEALDERGYFDPGYDPGWLDRFRDWRAVSFLLDDLDDDNPELDDPDTLKEWFFKLRDDYFNVRDLMEVYTRRQSVLVRLKEEHDTLVGQPQRILAELQTALGEALLEHLAACPETLRFELVAHDPVLVTFLKKVRGLEKQAAYLSELRVTRIRAQVDSLDQALAKLRRKMTKARLKGYRKTYDARTMTSMRTLKAEKWKKRHDRLGRMRGRIAGFDRWDRGSLSEDYLWWDLVSRGASGDDLYEVRTFRRDHPDFDHTTWVDPIQPTEPMQALGAAMQVHLLQGAARELADKMSGSADDGVGDIS